MSKSNTLSGGWRVFIRINHNGFSVTMPVFYSPRRTPWEEEAVQSHETPLGRIPARYRERSNPVPLKKTSFAAAAAESTATGSED